MATYDAQAGRLSYGVPIGILMLDCNIPFIPGDVGNATSYPFPVLFHKVPGATFPAVVNQDQALVPILTEAAQYLESQGVRAITSDCGYFGAFQQDVAAAVDVPVFFSSLMQVPLILATLSPRKKLGLIVANGKGLEQTMPDGKRRRDSLFAKVGITDQSRLAIGGMEDKPHFHQVVHDECGWMDSDRMERETVERACELLQEEPSVGAFLLECSDLPPYGAAVQRATGLPVFDWISFIKYMEQAVCRRPYEGLV